MIFHVNKVFLRIIIEDYSGSTNKFSHISSVFAHYTTWLYEFVSTRLFSFFYSVIIFHFANISIFAHLFVSPNPYIKICFHPYFLHFQYINVISSAKSRRLIFLYLSTLSRFFFITVISYLYK